MAHAAHGETEDGGAEGGGERRRERAGHPRWSTEGREAVLVRAQEEATPTARDDRGHPRAAAGLALAVGGWAPDAPPPADIDAQKMSRGPGAEAATAGGRAEARTRPSKEICSGRVSPRRRATVAEGREGRDADRSAVG